MLLQNVALLLSIVTACFGLLAVIEQRRRVPRLIAQVAQLQEIEERLPAGSADSAAVAELVSRLTTLIVESATPYEWRAKKGNTDRVATVPETLSVGIATVAAIAGGVFAVVTNPPATSPDGVFLVVLALATALVVFGVPRLQARRRRRGRRLDEASGSNAGQGEPPNR